MENRSGGLWANALLKESEDEDDDDEEDDEEDDEDDEGSDVDMVDEEPKSELRSPSKRKKAVEEPVAESIDSVSAAAEEEEETSATVDDGLPHPRVSLAPPFSGSFRFWSRGTTTNSSQPFESRREFFVRTSAEWQDILMTNLRFKGIQPEGLSIKEIKTKAFELSEEKWWDCREEILALEEEQEAAGITEVVSLADRGEGGPRRR